MSIYLRNAGPTLIGLLSKVAQRDADRHDLSDEIDLSRAVAVQATQLYSALLDEPKVREDQKMVAGKIVQEATEHVTKMVMASARVRATEEGLIELKTLQWIVAEVARAIEEVVRGPQPELAEALVKRIAQIKVPSQDSGVGAFLGGASDESFM